MRDRQARRAAQQAKLAAMSWPKRLGLVAVFFVAALLAIMLTRYVGGAEADWGRSLLYAAAISLVPAYQFLVVPSRD